MESDYAYDNPFAENTDTGAFGTDTASIANPFADLESSYGPGTSDVPITATSNSVDTLASPLDASLTAPTFEAPETHAQTPPNDLFTSLYGDGPGFTPTGVIDGLKDVPGGEVNGADVNDYVPESALVMESSTAHSTWPGTETEEEPDAWGETRPESLSGGVHGVSEGADGGFASSPNAFASSSNAFTAPSDTFTSQSAALTSLSDAALNFTGPEFTAPVTPWNAFTPEPSHESWNGPVKADTAKTQDAMALLLGAPEPSGGFGSRKVSGKKAHTWLDDAISPDAGPLGALLGDGQTSGDEHVGRDEQRPTAVSAETHRRIPANKRTVVATDALIGGSVEPEASESAETASRGLENTLVGGVGGAGEGTPGTVPAVASVEPVASAADATADAAAPVSTAPPPPPFIITVSDPQKVGPALNPAAQYVVYTVHTKTSSDLFRKKDMTVLRRFSHFLWLYETLVKNNPGVVVPGIPDKHGVKLGANFAAHFVETRRKGLELALRKMTSHPMLVGDPDLRLFLEDDAFEYTIKQRELSTKTTSLFSKLSLNHSTPKFVEFDEFFVDKKAFLDEYEAQLQELVHVLSGTVKQTHAYQESLEELSQSLNVLSHSDILPPHVQSAFDRTGALYHTLAATTKSDAIDSLINTLSSYARLCHSAKLVFSARVKAYHTWQTAETELEKARSAHDKAKRTNPNLIPGTLSQLSAVHKRTLDAKQDFEDVTKLTKAEMARLEQERLDDIAEAVRGYVDALVEKQRKVTKLWKDHYEALVKLSESN